LEILLSKLALIRQHSSHALERHHFPDTSLAPRRGLRRMFVKEVRSTPNLLSVKPATPGQVHPCSANLILDDRWIAAGFVEILYI
jgi:hypothetical protein